MSTHIKFPNKCGIIFTYSILNSVSIGINIFFVDQEWYKYQFEEHCQVKCELNISWTPPPRTLVIISITGMISDTFVHKIKLFVN